MRPPACAQGARAVFLHTGWRSAGTWIWTRCREQARVHGLYEPLHEHLGRLKAADMSSLRPDSWASNHSQTAPYFQEYIRLLTPGRRGLALHRRRFAFERFFLAPQDEDAELEAYLGGLLAASGPDRVSVLKFCRSLGRVGWMERRFPQAMHAVVLRDPVTQWASALALLTEARNRYFTVAPLMALACNAQHPLVREALSALGVRTPALHSQDLAYVTETCWRHLRRQDDFARYRLFLAFWTATALHALRSRALVVDPVRLVADGSHRAAVEAAFRSEIGQAFSLGSRPGSAHPGTARRVPSLPASLRHEAHCAAADMVRRQARAGAGGRDAGPSRRRGWPGRRPLRAAGRRTLRSSAAAQPRPACGDAGHGPDRAGAAAATPSSRRARHVQMT